MTMNRPVPFALVLLAVVLAACGPGRSGPRTADVPTLEPRNANAVQVYERGPPRCGFREVGTVSGSTYRDLQSAAFRLHANAVIVDPQGGAGRIGNSVMTATAVAFTRADCQQ